MSSSSNATILTGEPSDPSHGTRTKRRRSNREVHPTSYKGVVMQQNSNWGAQIYFNNREVHPSRLANYVYPLGKTKQDFLTAHPRDTRRGYFRKMLFQKELTPSDVGKLNRLVIPKKAVVTFFPPVPVREEGRDAKEAELTLYDGSMLMWNFRYCYWKSSQSFVFTRK